MKTEKSFDVYRPFIPPHISPRAFQQHRLVVPADAKGMQGAKS